MLIFFLDEFAQAISYVFDLDPKYEPDYGYLKTILLSENGGK